MELAQARLNKLTTIFLVHQLFYSLNFNFSNHFTWSCDKLPQNILDIILSIENLPLHFDSCMPGVASYDQCCIFTLVNRKNHVITLYIRKHYICLVSLSKAPMITQKFSSSYAITSNIISSFYLAKNLILYLYIPLSEPNNTLFIP